MALYSGYNLVGNLQRRTCLAALCVSKTVFAPKGDLTPMSQTDNVLDMARHQLSVAATHLDLDEGLLEALSRPKRQVVVNFPVVMDNRLVGSITRQNVLRALEYLSDPESKKKPGKQSTKQQIHV